MPIVAMNPKTGIDKDIEYERFTRQIKKLTDMAWKAYQENAYGFVQMNFESGRVSGFVYHVTEKPAA